MSVKDTSMDVMLLRAKENFARKDSHIIWILYVDLDLNLFNVKFSFGRGQVHSMTTTKDDYCPLVLMIPYSGIDISVCLQSRVRIVFVFMVDQ